MKFTTTMGQFGNNTGIEVPDDVVEKLGAGKRPAVVVDVNGFEYRSTIAPMGGKFLIPFSSDKRKATGIGGGDKITVTLTVDTESRAVEPPADLKKALQAAEALGRFEALSPSKQKAHVTSVEGAKAADTRARRIRKVVDELS